jgi:small-conductance mechanosensitive channel
MDLEILTREFFGNTVAAYLVSAGIVLLGLVAVAIIRIVIGRRARAWASRPDTPVDGTLFAKAQRSSFYLLMLLALALGLRGLEFTPGVERIVSMVILILAGLFSVGLVTSVIALVMDSHLRRQGRSMEDFKGRALMPIIKAIVWLVALIFVLDNMGFDVTSLVAGLGVAGLAIGIAAQAVLGDLFSYFAIIFDKPFQLGDFVIVGDYMGTIEHLGIKTTRLRSLSGEQIIVSNSDLTGSRVRNYKRMYERRIAFAFGVTYDTPADTLEAVKKTVHEIIDGAENARFDRAHFKAFGASSLDFEVVFYVLSPEYNVYMDVQEAINLEIVRRLNAMGVEFAFPTRTLYLREESGWAQEPEQG